MSQHPITGIEIAGCGLALPSRSVSNFELINEKGYNSSDEWLRTKVGIASRYYSEWDETSPSRTLASKAAQEALRMAGLSKPYGIDVLRVGTWTSDMKTPGTANDVNSELGLKAGKVSDQNAACASFVYSINDTFNDFKVDDDIKTGLVIGTDILSRHTDFNDRDTAMLFGDGAGAVLLKRNENRPDAGLVAWHYETDSDLIPALYVDQNSGYIKMIGNLVLQKVVPLCVEVGSIVLKKAYENMKSEKDDIGMFILHQANIRIINMIAKRLNIPLEKMAITIDRHANTSSSSIPMALTEMVTAGKVKRGDPIMMLGFGAGVTVAGSVLIF